jgi:hypothetical protein
MIGPFAHSEQDGITSDRHDRLAVGGDDRQRMLVDREREQRVGGGVDQAQSQTLAAPHGDGKRVRRRPPVDEVERGSGRRLRRAAWPRGDCRAQRVCRRGDRRLQP